MQAPVTGEQALRIARGACSRWRHLPEFDDLVSVAAAAIMDAGVEDRPALAAVVARRRAIDWARRHAGWRRPGRAHHHQPALVGDVEVFDALASPVAPPDLKPSTLLGLDGRDAVIADMLGAGHSKCSVAAALGVSPGRVTQLLPRIAAQVAAPDGVSPSPSGAARVDA